jgi:Uma2 family endonuclease
VNAMALAHRLDAPTLGYDQWLAVEETTLPCEVVDGQLIMTPPPSTLHQRAVTRLAVILSAAVPPALEVLVSPVGWVLSRDPLHVREPDLVVVEASAVGGPLLSTAPVLAVEVVSPASRERDLVAKRTAYAEAGLGWYWLVDVDVPQILILRNAGGTFVEHRSAVGEEAIAIADPFTVQVSPAALR